MSHTSSTGNRKRYAGPGSGRLSPVACEHNTHTHTHTHRHTHTHTHVWARIIGAQPAVVHLHVYSAECLFALYMSLCVSAPCRTHLPHSFDHICHLTGLSHVYEPHTTRLQTHDSIDHKHIYTHTPLHRQRPYNLPTASCCGHMYMTSLCVNACLGR